MGHLVTLDLTTFSLEILLITKDYVESELNYDVPIRYEGSSAILEFKSDSDINLFNAELSDFIKRKIVADKTRSIKEIVIGRALYGIVEELD